jgi:hypothetical protein
MTDFVEVPIGELFKPISGSPKFIRSYIESNRGEYPVYSASLLRPFGYVAEYQFDGHYLSWTMNGYGGHVSEIRDKFSLTRDRGIFVPREGVQLPDLTYLRTVMEPSLKAAAVGRRIDGKLNTYTKIYPETAAQVHIRLPLDKSGRLDVGLMKKLGERYRRVEAARQEILALLEDMKKSSLAFGSALDDVESLSLGGDWMEFVSSKTGWTKTDYGKLDTRDPADIPLYTAARGPVAYVKVKHAGLIKATPAQPIISFAANGDGSAGTNFVFHEKPFYVSNDRTCLRVCDETIDPWYVYFALNGMKARYGFGHSFKATSRNLGEVSFNIPVKAKKFDLARQLEVVERFRTALEAKKLVQAELERVGEARLSIGD